MPGPQSTATAQMAAYAGRLRWLRARSGADPAQAATAAGLSVGFYRGLETGAVDWGGVTVLTVHALLDALAVKDERDLLGDPHTPGPCPPTTPRPRRSNDHPHLVPLP